MWVILTPLHGAEVSMSFRRLPMKQLLELARLRFGMARSYSEIAGNLGVARSTVQEAVRRFRSAGLSWPLPELDEDVLYARLYPVTVTSGTSEPDFAALSKELARKGARRASCCGANMPSSTRARHWPTRSSARAFRIERRTDPVMRLVHKPGARMFVDYAGMTMPITDRHTGEMTLAQIFVAALGYSHAIYAETSASQKAADWIGLNSRALRFFGGVPRGNRAG